MKKISLLLLAANTKELNASHKTINQQLKALIARNIWRNEGFYSVINKDDKSIEVAVREISK